MAQTSKKDRGVVLAIIVAALIIAVGILIAFSAYGPGARTTLTTSAPLQLHTVVFDETGYGCGSQTLYAESWAVTLDGVTIVQPSNATLPVSGSEASSAFQSIHTITFTLPDGIYDYNVSSSSGPLLPSQSRGAVTVNGSDVAINLDFPEGSCYGP